MSIEKTWYYVLVEEWLVPTESGRRVLESTYDTIDEAREAAISHLRAEKSDFELTTGLKATDPEEYGDYMAISTPAEGQDDEWYDCVKIIPLSYGVMPIIGHKLEMPPHKTVDEACAS